MKTLRSAIFLCLSFFCGLADSQGAASGRPNIVWIVGEDLGPELGCYGDRDAITPELDRLAAQGARFTRCFTHAPVCAPSRSGLITGRYPIAIGTHHMRSRLLQPPVTFTQLLRESGYHVAWPGKTDFNFAEPKGFADSRADWLKSGETLPEPFFAYVNFGASHESQVRNDGARFDKNTARLTAPQRRDPAKVALPPFWPDDPEIRREVANYHELVTAVDYSVGDVLRWLDEKQLAERTIVIFFGDHGRGMPRHKRWVYDSGTHVPLLVRWPGKIAPGTVREDLVSFVDLPATALAAAGVEIPKEFDGQVFLGPQQAPARQYVYAHRDYMDEVYDRIRSVRDERYRYVRNFAPDLPYAQRIDYMEIGKTMQAWRRWHAEGRLNEVQSLFFAPTKPIEELYDTQSDPHEVRNVVADPAYAEKLAELRAACEAWIIKTGDKGAIPIDQLISTGVIAPRDPKYSERLKSNSRKN